MKVNRLFRGVSARGQTAASGILRGRIAVLVCSFFCLFITGESAFAQDSSLDELPGLRERAVVMHITSRIVEQNREVVWNSENSKTTIPGRPVGLKLVGSDLVVAVQFTPFLRRNGKHLLVAQGQIWINVPNEGVRYHTTMQTIPLEFNEQVYFFPLGSLKDDEGARIEIQLVLEPYSKDSAEDPGWQSAGSEMPGHHRGPPPDRGGMNRAPRE